MAATAPRRASHQRKKGTADHTYAESSTSPDDSNDEDYNPDENGKAFTWTQRGRQFDDSLEADVSDTPVPIQSTRKRKRNKRKVEQKKRYRNLGKAYETNSTRKRESCVVPEKTIGPDCRCQLNCFECGNDAIEQCFTSFWEKGDFNAQNVYLGACMQISNVKRRYSQKKCNSRRQKTFSYHVNINGESVHICKKAFLSFHGLQHNRGRITNIQAQLRKGCSIIKPDGRGKHQRRENAYSEEAIAHVKRHIDIIPKYESHYSRNQNGKKRFLDMEHSIEECYRKYTNDYCREENIAPVSRDKYRRIFVECFNIGCKKPQSDTCKTCDSLKVKMGIATNENDVETFNKLKEEKELHLRKAQAGQQVISEFGKKMKETPESFHVVTFDLQQALPTPKLSTGPAFYKRKMWTYNVNVHNCGTGEGHMFVWDESVASRGSDEIGSCLKRYIEMNDVKAETLVLVSDNCGGQNKNWNIVALLSWLASTGRFKYIFHYFPISGHTMLPSDQDFATIETYVRLHAQYVYTPDEWRELISNACKKRPFTVHNMTMENFVNLQVCRKSITPRKKTTDKENVHFKDAVKFSYSADKPGILGITYSYADINGDEVDISRRGSHLGQVTFPQKYLSARPVDSLKLRDVLSLMQYIPPCHHPFYTSLKAANKSLIRQVEDVDGEPEEQLLMT